MTPKTPFDTKLAKAQKEAEAQETAIEKALEDRERALDALRVLIDAGQDDTKEAAVLQAKAEGAVGDYKRADHLRLEARARLTALEAARERWLLEHHDIFPPRRSYGTIRPLSATEAAAERHGAELKFPTPTPPPERSEPIAAVGGMKSSDGTETK